MRISENHDLRKTYRNIFLVEDRNFWESCPFDFDREKDLVLTFDHALLRQMTSLGASAAYLDHFIKPESLEALNHQTYDFFAAWYLDSAGQDIFLYEGINAGLAFRVELWNDVTFSVRLIAHCLAVRALTYEKIYVGGENRLLMDVLDYLGMKAESWSAAERKHKVFYFPAFRFFRDFQYYFLKKNSLSSLLLGKNFIKAVVTAGLDFVLALADRLGARRTGKVRIYAESYYSTQDVIARLMTDERLDIVVERYVWGLDLFRQRRLPHILKAKPYRQLAEALLADFNRRKQAALILDGVRISDFVYRQIVERIGSSLIEYLKYIDDINAYFTRYKLDLMLTYSSVGATNCLMLDFCHKKHIPVYNILNGLLLHSFDEEENRYFTWINSYGESIKADYFHHADNVICLGDPRLDRYVKDPWRKTPPPPHDQPQRLLIGASGFSAMDLNSYLAVEFDYLFDILSACRALKNNGEKIDVALKLKACSYLQQYLDFIEEYFPDVPVKIYGWVPMRDVLKQSDLYVATYSGTVFEASILGLPVLYYKNDREFFIPPYDGKSALVTACSAGEVAAKLALLCRQDKIFDAFNDRSVMQKYVGPLDGKNTDRNVEFIYSLINNGSAAGCSNAAIFSK
ncbi:MAG: hypothetical protein HQL22_07145 [Candidatus Omnitrophica bacterium]|nr:hypothetical protein [Candidatus Omnitrophota bacterium]